MDISSFLGFFLAFGTVIFTIYYEGSHIGLYLCPSAFIIVFGGMVASTVTCFPFSKVVTVHRVIIKIFFSSRQEPLEKIELLVRFAERARREGILALENAITEVNDPFLRSGIQLAVDGVEPQLIKDILQTELSFLEERHKTGQALFSTMGFYGPAYGMVGTLIGMVSLLSEMSDPSKIGPAMAVALLATFYGAFLSNGIFLPMAEKLKKKTQEEIMIKELTIEGIMAIQSGDNPRIVRQKLLAFLPPDLRSQVSEGAEK